MIKTRVTELLGIKHPILCGPMRNVSEPGLTAAVSNAGGLGMTMGMWGGYRTPAEVVEEVKKTRSMTDKPFAVTTPALQAPDEDAMKKLWDETFAPMIDAGCDVIETIGRIPDPFAKLMKESKVKWLHRATRTKDCVKIEQMGVDAVVLMGFESAGNPGAEDVTIMVRIPIATDTVKIPVIAAGGIADGRGLAAALALGAEGVMMGTRFTCTKESIVHANSKKLLMETPENGLIVIPKPIPMEVVRAAGTFVEYVKVVPTPWADKMLKMQEGGAGPKELMDNIALVTKNLAILEGDNDNGGPLSPGPVIGLVNDDPSCAELLERMVSEAEAMAKRLHDSGIFK